MDNIVKISLINNYIKFKRWQSQIFGDIEFEEEKANHEIHKN